jgi:methylase of polypeptide subunit release factors
MGSQALITPLRHPESGTSRKARGAFFTPAPIAEYLAQWAIRGNPSARVLDPTCGDGVFLLAAGKTLTALGARVDDLDSQLVGLDLHAPSLVRADRLLEDASLEARLTPGDFFAQTPPDELFSSWQHFDAVIGNPPFVRYQTHVGEARRLSAQAALRQGVRLSGLASSWAALLVHAGAFLSPSGRIAMVLPAELLSVGYAEPVRRWLRRRFAAVNLVVFEHLQFDDALENVILLLAQGSGGCDAFNVFYVGDASDLTQIRPFDGSAIALADEGKWTEMFLSLTDRQLYRRVVNQHFEPLGSYGLTELGTVTGANKYFALDEPTRTRFGLRPDVDVVRISPPGTRHLQSLAFGRHDWDTLRTAGEPVWLFCPPGGVTNDGIEAYKALGRSIDVPSAYKCQIRSEWWRPPSVPTPDLFFTYMSHRYPRLITNRARVGFLNSMHGVRLRPTAPPVAREALPLLALNSVTMLGAEILGRSYGGGVLKMEPSEARSLPMPKPDCLVRAWAVLRPERAQLDRHLRDGRWTNVVARVDEVLLRQVMGLTVEDAAQLYSAGSGLRTRRLSRGKVASQA